MAPTVNRLSSTVVYEKDYWLLRSTTQRKYLDKALIVTLLEESGERNSVLFKSTSHLQPPSWK
jgi:hypothetical protein